MEEKIFKALKAGAGGYLLKKDSFVRLGEDIRMLYHNGAPVSPEIARKVIAYFHQDARPGFDSLSARETRVLELIVEGLLYKEIAGRLNVTEASQIFGPWLTSTQYIPRSATALEKLSNSTGLTT